MGDVVVLEQATRLDIPAERVLHHALEVGMNGAVVIGYDKDDGFYFASSIADGGDVLWLLELAKKKLLEIDDG